MPPRRVLVARHGERLDFIDPDYRDTADLPDDPPLTARGEQQARALGARLRGFNVTAVYASPFQRCLRTAAIAIATAAHEPDGVEDAAGADEGKVDGMERRRKSPPRVRVEPGLCERLSAVRYFQTESGPAWRSLETLSSTGVATVDDVDLLDTSHVPVLPHSFNTDGYPESNAAMDVRCRRVVSEILARDDSHGDVLLVGHVSSVKGMVGVLAPDVSTFRLSVPYCCLSVFAQIPDAQDADAQGAYKTELLCTNDFQPAETRTPSVSEWAGGFPRTKYVLMMARGLAYSAWNSKP